MVVRGSFYDAVAPLLERVGGSHRHAMKLYTDTREDAIGDDLVGARLFSSPTHHVLLVPLCATACLIVSHLSRAFAIPRPYSLHAEH